MGDLTLFQLVEKLAAGGFATFLIVILIAGQKRVWVWGYHLDDTIREKDTYYDDMVKEKNALIAYERNEKDEWRTLAWETKKLTEKSVSLAQTAVGNEGQK